MGNLNRRRLTTGAAAVAVVLSVVAVAVGLLAARSSPPSIAERTAAIGQTLKCPTCQALSVAESDSPMAMSMRAEIRQQLRQGRSADQVRSWFADRYGQQVLLTPSTHGASLLLWAVPVAVLVAGVLAVFVVLRRRRTDREAGDLSPPVGVPYRRLGMVAGCLVVVGVGVSVASWTTSDDGAASASASTPTTGSPSTSRPAMSADAWVAVGQSLERQQAYGKAAQAYRRALGQQPGDAALRTRLAFVLVRAGKPANAVALVTPLTRSSGSSAQRAEATLVLGLAQWAERSPDAVGTLRAFLRLAPDNPAAPQVRRLLAGAS